MKELIFDLSKLPLDQIAVFQTGVIDTLEQLGIDVEYDETAISGKETPDRVTYKVLINCPKFFPEQVGNDE